MQSEKRKEYLRNYRKTEEFKAKRRAKRDCKKEYQQYGKEYQQKNKERFNEYRRTDEYKAKRRVKRDCKKEYQQYGKEYGKEYRNEKLNHCIYAFLIKDKIYIGSTSHIEERMSQHKIKALIYPERKLYQCVHEAGGWDKVERYIVMENIPFLELRLKLEQHFIDMIPEELKLNVYDVCNI